MLFDFKFTSTVALALALAASDVVAGHNPVDHGVHARGFIKRHAPSGTDGIDAAKRDVQPNIVARQVLLNGLPVPSGVGLGRDINGVTTKGSGQPTLQPACGPQLMSNCVNLLAAKTIISFGDSYTYCGVGDGKPCPAASLKTQGLPESGTIENFGSNGRVTNGPTWIELLAGGQNIQLHNFALSGAVVNRMAENVRENKDLTDQFQNFQNSGIKTDPKSTMCTFFFGINDQSMTNGTSKLMQKAAQIEVSYIDKLKSSCGQFIYIDIQPEASDFSKTLRMEVFKLAKSGKRVAYVSIAQLLNKMKSEASLYGFKTTGPCLTSSDFVSFKNVCKADEVNASLYYMGHHPSALAHDHMATYIEAALQFPCPASGGKTCPAA